MSNGVRHIMPDCFLHIEDRDWRMLLYSSVITLWQYNGPQWFSSVVELVREAAIFHASANEWDHEHLPTTDVDSIDHVVKQTVNTLKQNRDVIDNHLSVALPIDICDGKILQLLPTSVITSNVATELEQLDETKGTIIIAG